MRKAAIIAVTLLASCTASQNTPDIDPLEAYDAAVEAEAAALEPTPGELAPQLRVGVKLNAVSGLVKRGFAAGLAESLSESGKVSVLGKEFDLSWSSRIADVKLSPDDACLSCLKADVVLAGKWEFALPLTKASSGTSSQFSVVAPAKVVREDDGRLVVQLDPSEAVNIGGFQVESKLDKVPEKFAGPVKERLASWLEAAAQRTLGKVPPLRLFELQPLELGAGVELVPTGVAFEATSGTVYLGATTNKGTAVDLGTPPALTPEQGASLAMAISLLQTALAAQLRNGTLSRRYDTEGNPAEDGEIGVTVDGVTITDGIARVAMSMWQLSGPDAGRRETHVKDLAVSAPPSEGTPLPPALQALGAASSKLWSRVHYAPLAVPGFEFGVGTVVAAPSEDVVVSTFGLVAAE